MKTLFFFSFVCLFSWTSKATTELIEASDLGRTHVDPITMSTFINYKTNYQYDLPKVTYARCKLDAADKPIKNYFIMKKKDDNGVVRDLSTVKPGSSCVELMKKDSAIINCEDHSALEMTISDPDECAQGKCPSLATPRVASAPLPINLENEKLQEEIKKCSPEKQFVLIKDNMAESKSLIASLTNKSLCTLSKRRIFTEGAPWDSDAETHGNLPIQTSDNPNGGFFVGPNIQYYFDSKYNQWCIHLMPESGSREPKCLYNGRTKALAVGAPSDKKYPDCTVFSAKKDSCLDDVKVKGVVQLGVDKNGNPEAIIGHAKSSQYSSEKDPELDETKPFIRVSMANRNEAVCAASFGPSSTAQNPAAFKKCMDGTKGGRLTVFESVKDGKVVRKINQSPTYSFGNAVSAANSCDNNACLQGPTEVLSADNSLHCSKTNKQPFQTLGTNKEVCYSCNGVSSGSCGLDKVVLNKNNLAEYTQKISACRSSTAEAASPPNGDPDVIK